MRNNPYGSLDRKLNLGEMYEHRNLYDDFLGSDAFKAIETDAVAWEHDSRNGFYIITSAGEKKPIPYHKLDQAFRVWANQELKGYAPYMEKYAGKKFLNDKGELEFDKPGHELNSILKAVLNATKGNFSSSKTKISPDSGAISLYNAQQAGKGTEVNDEGVIASEIGIDMEDMNVEELKEIHELVKQAIKDGSLNGLGLNKIQIDKDGKINRDNLKKAFNIVNANKSNLNQGLIDEIVKYSKEKSRYYTIPYTANNAKMVFGANVDKGNVENTIKRSLATNRYTFRGISAGNTINRKDIVPSEIQGEIDEISFAQDKKTEEYLIEVTFKHKNDKIGKTTRNSYIIDKSLTDDIKAELNKKEQTEK